MLIRWQNLYRMIFCFKVLKFNVPSSQNYSNWSKFRYFWFLNTIEVHVNFPTCFEMLKMASCCLIYLVKTNQINGRDPVQNLPELPNFIQYYTWCQACGWRPDDICHLPVKSHPKSHSRVIRMSSAGHLHVVRTSSARDFNSQNISI